MVFVKHNSLKSDIFFNLIFIPDFSGSRFFRAQVFEGPGFPGSRFFRVQGPGSRVQGPRPGSRVRVQGPGPSPGSRVWARVRVRVQGLGPGFRSSQQFSFFICFQGRLQGKNCYQKVIQKACYYY